ncbi:hypothetical protein EYZ11_013207 [Aspergillus tanneri]|uniref:Methyltransferase n=1 Tax=Aspergillus tanneri TaxID=1220188 RepID=A0A4V6RQL8_9EURO|nr:hypothetical protein EYZ11_013207 [Aspergillus tanneri]
MTITTTTTKTTRIPSGPVEAQLVFYSPPADNSPPYNYVETPPPGLPQRNYNEETHKVTITDIRPPPNSNPAEPTTTKIPDYTLSTSAFEILSSISTSTTTSTFDSDTSIRESYYPEITHLLLSHLNAEKVIIFDHTIRRAADPAAPRGPVHRAHVDQTAYAAAERIKLHVPSSFSSSPSSSDKEKEDENKNEEEELIRACLQGEKRYRIINVWKPLNGPVESSPLAFASADTVDVERDLVPVQHRYPHRVGETMAVRYNPHQKWLYVSGMRDDERLLLQCSDSWADKTGGLKVVPHTAFWDPRTKEDAKPRESIEVRTLVIG